MTETLSSKIIEAKDPSLSAKVVFVEDVKDFIKKLKEAIEKHKRKEVTKRLIYRIDVDRLIDKLAGDDLI